MTFRIFLIIFFLLGNPIKRKSYDSIDPEFDDGLPTSSEIEKDYFGIFTDQFTRNAVWSEKKNVPLIGKYNFFNYFLFYFYLNGNLILVRCLQCSI